MPWGVAVAAVVGAYSANEQAKAGEKGADAQSNAAAANVAENARQYDQTREDQLPFLQAGTKALERQEAYLRGDTSGFANSADYRFAVDQGFQGLNRGLAARGGAAPGGFGGGADADRIALGQGLATQYANNYWEKLARQAGQGQSSAANLGGLGAQYAGMNNQQNTNAAQARASAYANTANAWGNYASQLGSMAGQYYGQNSFGGV